MSTTTKPQPELKLYYAPASCALSVHIILNLSPLKFTAVANKSGPTGTVFVEGYHLINPKLRVPALTIDGDSVTEVVAVMTAVDYLWPEGQILGRSGLEKIRVYEWFGYLSTALHATGFAAKFRPDRFTTEESGYEAVKAKALQKVTEVFEFVEGKLVAKNGKEGEKGVWAVGEHLTAADPYLFVFFRWGNVNGFVMKERFPAYTRLVRALLEMEEVRRTLGVEGIKSTLEE